MWFKVVSFQYQISKSMGWMELTIKQIWEDVDFVNSQIHSQKNAYCVGQEPT